MLRHTRYRPYIRRANGREDAADFRTALRLVFYRELKKPFFVLVQRGTPNTVMTVGSSREAIQESIVFVRGKRRAFRKWARKIQKFASGKK